MNKTNKHENYEILNLIGYGLAKFNDLFIQEFGFNTKTSFYTAMVEYGVAETGSVLKNRQESPLADHPGPGIPSPRASERYHREGRHRRRIPAADSHAPGGV